MFLGRSNPTEGLLHSSWTGRANLNKCLVQPCWGTCMGNQVRTRCRWPPMLASTRRKKKQKTAQRISLSLDNRGPHKCSGAVKRHCLRPVACQVVLPAYFCVATCCAQGVFRAVEPASCLWPWTWLSHPVQSSPRRAALGRLHPDGANGVDYIWYKRPGSSRQICFRLYPAG